MTTIPIRSARGTPSFTLATLGVLAACLWATPPADAAPGSWSRGADLPMAISTPAACAVDDILYVVGGHDRNYRQLATVFAYDPKSDAWTRKKDMPTPRRWLGAVAVDGIVYAIGGGGWRDPVLKVVEAYDPKTDTWTTRTPMSTARFTFTACVVDGIIYAMGGGNDDMDGLASVEAYDPKTDRWSAKHRLPIATGMLAASVIDGQIHVCHGTNVYSYRPVDDQWTTRAPFTTWRHASMAAAVDGLIYLFGGCTEDYASAFDLATAYDPVRATVSNRRWMPRTRAFGTSAVIDGKIYLVGGADQEPIINPSAIFWKVLDVFDPQGGVDPSILSAHLEGLTLLRLTWQADLGQRYGVVSAPNVTRGPWSLRLSFSTGTNAVLATNATMEAVVVLPSPSTPRFLRVVEAR